MHSAGKKITEENLKKVMTASGVKADAARVKAIVSALEGVNIDEAVKSAPVVAAPAAAQPVGGKPTEAKAGEAKEKKTEEEEKKSEEEAASGLSSLFG